jgi:uncharacterized protein YbjT (DUF2867 family)
MREARTVVVFGATGQQGGAVVSALRADGWRIRAAMRDPRLPAARALAASGVSTVQSDFNDPGSLRSAMSGAHGVFSVQPSSGQGAAYGVTDEDEIRYGKAVIDAAAACGVQHLVYSSGNAVRPEKSGIGHFDSKAEIEAYLSQSAVPNTVIRPSAFMEILLTPGLGLEQGRMNFFMRPDQAMQFVAVRDIGLIVARIFGDSQRYVARTIEVAGDSLTGIALAEKFSAAAERPITYQRFGDQVLKDTPLLADLAALVDAGRLAGHADVDALTLEFPGLLKMDDWLHGPGRQAFSAALLASGDLALR